MTESSSSSTPTDTPSSSSSGPLPEGRSPRSVPEAVTAQLCGTGVSLFCASKAAQLLSCTATDLGPLGLPRWLWGLAALVLVAVPTSAYQARKIFQAVLAARAGKGAGGA